MSIVFNVLEIVAPVFILAAIGFAWIKLGFEYRIEFVTKMAMTLSVPCLIFVSLMKTRINPEALTATLLATVVVYILITAIFLVLVKLFDLEVKSFWAPMIFSNTGNLGLPLALYAFGEIGLSYAIIIFAVMAVYSFSLGVWMVSGGGSPLKVVKEPIVWGTLLGAVFMVQGWQTPTWMTNSLDLIGQLAIPLMLITLGVALARLQAPSLGRAIWLSGLKFLICAGISLAVGRWMNLEPVALAVLIVQFSTPVAVTSYLLAQKYGANAEEVAGLVVVSTALSILALPLLLGFLL
ncbi:MAG: AEC family transporter [Arenicella sp.]